MSKPIEIKLPEFATDLVRAASTGAIHMALDSIETVKTHWEGISSEDRAYLSPFREIDDQWAPQMFAGFDPELFELDVLPPPSASKVAPPVEHSSPQALTFDCVQLASDAEGFIVTPRALTHDAEPMVIDIMPNVTANEFVDAEIVRC